MEEPKTKLDVLKALQKTNLSSAEMVEVNYRIMIMEATKRLKEDVNLLKSKEEAATHLAATDAIRKHMLTAIPYEVKPAIFDLAESDRTLFQRYSTLYNVDQYKKGYVIAINKMLAKWYDYRNMIIPIKITSN